MRGESLPVQDELINQVSAWPLTSVALRGLREYTPTVMTGQLDDLQRILGDLGNKKKYTDPDVFPGVTKFRSILAEPLALRVFLETGAHHGVPRGGTDRTLDRLRESGEIGNGEFDPRDFEGLAAGVLIEGYSRFLEPISKPT